MIKYLVGEEYPGSRIGPEPTTDCFVAIYHSDQPRQTMGTTLAADSSMPFQSLNLFGQCFLTRFRGASLSSPILEQITFLDTPGILSGQKQTSNRGYDFAQVVHFMASKVDMIVLLFDTSKLDISDEYKMVLHNLRGNEEKIKIVLNKADMVSPGELIRVRGALMWSLSKILSSVEVPRVFIGSFWENCKKEKDILDLFTIDYEELFKELQALPNQVLIRKFNDIIKRAKSVKNHALIMHEILSKGCSKQGAIKKHMSEIKMEQIYIDIKKSHRLTDSDLPDPVVFREKAANSVLKKWNKMNPKLVAKLEEFLSEDVGKLLAVLPASNEIPSVLKRSFNNLMTSRSETDTNASDAPKSNLSPSK
ncbi:hypothetical protein L596_024639 [Steinernema carpocapsae]|nr:hypothetical protein L596_024639 [Steinernema carpocapsae]